MYPISALYADLLRRPDRTFIVKAIVNGEDYDNTRIVDFQIENSLTLSDEFQIGTAIPSKLTIKLRTTDIIPANAKIVPYLSMSMDHVTWQDATYPWEEMAVAWQGGGTDWMPLGEFYVDSREKINDVWTFTCYDKLVFADVAYVSSQTYPTTQKAVWDEIMNRLGWTYDSSVVINPTYTIQAGPAGYTMRQVLAYIAAANSASVIMGKDGKVRFKRFVAADPVVMAMTSADYVRVKQTNPVKTYSRVVVTYNTEDELTYEAGSGSDANTLFLENPFMTQSMVNNLHAALNGFSYLPITMDARGYPQLEQGDVISYEVDEGRSWLDSTFPWISADVAWDGISRYQTIVLHQVLGFAGGLKMSLEAPAQSEQKSEFQVDGSLTTAVNKLNKEAVKEGKSYYGATITRTAGLTIEREDHLSKAVFNSDELTFYQGSDKALWFDLSSRKFKFGGDLEAVGGTFSGNLSAAGGTFTGNLSAAGGTFSGNLTAAGGTFRGTLQGADGTFTGTLKAGRVEGGEIIGGSIRGTDITGSTITGAVFKTASNGRRIEIDSTGFRTYDSSNNNRIRINTGSDLGVSAVTFLSAGGTFAGEINSYQDLGDLSIISDSISIGSNNTANPIYLQGSARFNGPAIFNSLVSGIKVGIGDVTGLREELENIRYILRNHVHTVNIGTHNHGNKENANWGGTFTTSIP